MNLSKHNPIVEVETLKLDLTEDDLSQLNDYEFDYVVHLAAVSSIKNAKSNEQKTLDINLNGTRKLLVNVLRRKTPLKKLIFMSSVTVYQEVDTDITEDEEALVDQGANAYSYSKHLAELECKKYEDKIPMIIFRLANAYGPYQRVGKTPNLIPQIVDQALREHKIEIYNGDFARDFIYVSDIVEAILKGMESDFEGTLNLGTGYATKVSDIAQAVANELGVEVMDLKHKIDAPMELVPNIALVKDKLGWEPEVSLTEGLKKTIEYYKRS